MTKHESLKCEDGSVSHIGSVFFREDDAAGWLTFFRLWLCGAILAPAIEGTIYIASPKAHLFGLIVGIPVVLLFAGLFGMVGGMKLSLIFYCIIEPLFRCSQGKAWDAAFIIVFVLSRIAGVWIIMQKRW